MPALRNIMKFQHFFKVHQISSNLQNIFESSSETCMWNLSPFREVNLVHRKMLTVPALWNIMKFQHFFKVHQISSNLQNILESSSETCMWNLSPFREVNLFHRKMLTVPALEISWNFNIFSKFTKFHQTCRIYWNHHQKHACEIWAHSEKLFLSQKNADSAGPRNIMKFQHFFKVHQISSNLQNIFESSSETCMWNLSPFREVNLVHRKMLTVPALWNIMKFQHFFKVHQISSNLQNLLESSSETCMWNLSPFREVISQCIEISEISKNFQSSPNFIKLVNHHQKNACEI